jgi:hypothetical protein
MFSPLFDLFQLRSYDIQLMPEHLLTLSLRAPWKSRKDGEGRHIIGQRFKGGEIGLVWQHRLLD